MKSNSKVNWVAVAMLAAFWASHACGVEPPQVEPLMQAHAHNDYQHSRPLLDALDHGFCSVEADIWLVDDRLLVAHTALELRPERTLQGLYLEPLAERCLERSGWVYDRGRPITLLIDLKTDAATTYPALRQALEQYRALFASTAAGEPAAVQVILSGNRPMDVVAAEAESERLCGLDGRLPDLGSNPSKSLVPLVSDAWGSAFKWNGEGEMPAAERAQLRRYAEEAHAQGRRLRFWGYPDRVEVWRELQAAGVDLIGTDDLDKLQRFLTAKATGNGKAKLPLSRAAENGSAGASRSQVVSPEEKAMLTELAGSIERAVRRQDTNHPVFHGCIDWHSAVHGHWALLRIANATGEHGELAKEIAGRFDPAKMAAEAQYLREHPEFEMPYGRAWFLRLAIEYDQWRAANAPDAPNSLAAMADEVAASLLELYAAGGVVPSPQSREYANDAWALVQLHAFYTHRGDAERLKRVQDLVDENFLNVATAPDYVRFSLDAKRPDFFSVYGNWAYLLAHTQDAAAAAKFWNDTRALEEDLQPIVPMPGNAHHLGTNWSRAWALRAVGRTLSDEQERARLEAAYQAHVAGGMAQHAKSKDDYGAYGHWVPQFAVYAITEGTSTSEKGSSAMMDKDSQLIWLSESKQTAFGKVDFSEQSEAQRIFTAVWTLESEVNNGGFRLLFTNNDADIIEFTPQALRSIGANSCAKIVEDALLVVPGSVDLAQTDDQQRGTLDSLNTRIEQLNALSDDDAKRLDDVDVRFLACPDDLTELLHRFVLAHPEEFGPLP